MARHGEVSDHAAFETLAVGWALDALSDGDDTRFRNHLSHCPHCQSIVDESHATLAEMAYAAPDAEPPAGGRQRLLAALAVGDHSGADHSGEAAGSEDTGTVHSLSERRARRRVTWQPLVAAAAAVAIIAGLVGWNITVQNGRRAAQAQAARAVFAAKLLANPDVPHVALTDSKGTAVATVVQTSVGYDIVAASMPTNDTANSVYVLWAMSDGRAPRALGTFDVVHSGLDVRVVRSTTTGADFQRYAISHETGRRAPSRPHLVTASGTVGT